MSSLLIELKKLVEEDPELLVDVRIGSHIYNNLKILEIVDDGFTAIENRTTLLLIPLSGFNTIQVDISKTVKRKQKEDEDKNAVRV